MKLALSAVYEVIRFAWIRFVLILVFFSTGAVARADEKTGPALTSADHRQFLENYCVECHGSGRQKGGVRLDTLELAVTPENSHLWEDVVHNLQRGDMPPEDETQPKEPERRAFLQLAGERLSRYEDESSPGGNFRRLSNRQIVNSLKDLLELSTLSGDRLIKDPVDKHGFSRDSELLISQGYLDGYFGVMEAALARAIPDPEEKPQVFSILGNEWENTHWAGHHVLYQRKRTLYEGPEWIGDDFEIPLPPKHEHRMFLRHNEDSTDFRLSITVRNEPPVGGGEREKQEISLYLCNGFQRPYNLVASFAVPAKEGSQTFEVQGAMADYTGVLQGPIPIGDKHRDRGYWDRFRTLIVANHSELKDFKIRAPLPVLQTYFGRHFVVRKDDQWIKAGLKGRFKRSDTAHSYAENNQPAIYPQVMEKQGHVIVEQIEFETPYLETWPPRAFQSFLSSSGSLDREELPGKLQDFAARAWRRPLSGDEKTYIDQIFAGEIAADCSDLDALRNSLASILSDVRFLYLSDSENQTYDLVSRLALFLWRGQPDDELRELAASTEISDKDLLAQVERMLADDRKENFVDDFVDSWVGLGTFDQVAIDPNYYPKFIVRVRDHMREEPRAFFAHVLENGLSSLNFVDSDFVVVNETMADFYGIDGVHGQRFVPWPAPENRGGGLLAQAAVMLANSNGQHSHPVNRGVWIRARLLGDPPSDPPPEVPMLEDLDDEKDGGGEPLTVAAKLEKHLANGTTCYDCHKDIDPWGLAMENFDAIGLELKAGDPHGLDGIEVSIGDDLIHGLVPLKKLLLKKRSDDFAYGFTRYMLSFALGRRVTHRDEDDVLRIQAAFEKGDYRIDELVKAIVISDIFKQPLNQKRSL